MNIKRFVRCWNKVARKYIQDQQPNQFRCYNQNTGFVNRMDQNVAKYKIGFQMKKWWWLSFVWLVDVILQGMWVLYRTNKGEDNETLPLLVFRRDVANTFFSEIFKGKQIILEPCKDSKYPMRCLLWWYKTLPGAIWVKNQAGLKCAKTTLNAVT